MKSEVTQDRLSEADTMHRIYYKSCDQHSEVDQIVIEGRANLGKCRTRALSAFHERDNSIMVVIEPLLQLV